AAAAVLLAPEADWDLALFGVLLVFSVLGFLTAKKAESKLLISGTFLALVLAMVFLGGTPAALIGVVVTSIGWLVRWREEPHYLLNNVLTYAVFPLAGGVIFHASIQATGLTAADPLFYLCIFGLFQVVLAI